MVSDHCLENQKSLLLQFKNDLNFTTTLSTKLVHWNEASDCCSWEGVTCSKGRVIGLNLTKESIYGELVNSSTLFSLQHLQDLSLAYNNFSNSRIPAGFGYLMNLSYLNLSNAGFSGQIPVEISNLKRLVTLDLSTSSLSSFSMLKLENPNLAKLVQNLSEIKELYLDGVNISAPGNEWCQALSSSLPNLSVLSMSNCSLSGPLHSSFRKLQSLSVILLHNNSFSAAPVPEFFANFRNLTSLRLSSCELNGQFPEKIFEVPTLQTLDLSDNKQLSGTLQGFHSNGSLRSLVLSRTNFSGTLPDSIGNLKMLSRIDLSNCSFLGSIPSSMANLVQLFYLDMSSNSFTGPIPSLSMAKKLTQINISHNNLTGQINFTHWKDLTNVVNLDLRFNSLNGSIPVSLFSLPSLQNLQLSNNQFSGLLNESSNSSSSVLDTLDLSSNKLKGPIPMSVFELQGLKFLSLSSNNFDGSLQLNEIQQLTNLSNLDLSYNNLSIEYNGTNSSSSSFPQMATLKLVSCKLKTFPDFLKNQSKLTILDLSINHIKQGIPNWIWELSNLRYLNLSYNYLEGPLLNLSRLGTLDLRSNQLEGKLPDLPQFATYLDFSMNNFNSAIPASIGESLTFAYFFSVSSNKFHGDIPQSLCKATHLQVLNLSNNTLNGTIPPCLIEMSKTLGVLDVRRNKLSGNISDTFPYHCGLQTLNLNGNRLVGVVPRSLVNCTNLEVFDIGNNEISDVFPCYLASISKLRVLILRSNKFYGPINNCRRSRSNFLWPILQIVDLASNEFTGKIPRKFFSTWKAMLDEEDKARSMLNYLQFSSHYGQLYYQDRITVTSKGLAIELVKILTIFTSIDISANKLQGPIPETIGELKSLYVLNLSHNALTGKIPLSLGKLSRLESLDLSSNNITGEIPMQLVDLTFLAALNLSFNQLVGPIPQGKQFGTFSNYSYIHNKKLWGFPLTTPSATPKSKGTSSPPPTFEDSNSNSRPLIDWNFLSVELGFVFGLGMVIWPIMFCKRWRIRYCKHVDDILFRVFPQLYLGGKQYRGIRALGNAGRRH